MAGLETVDFQMRVLFGSQSLQRQASQLLAGMNHLADMEQQARSMTTAYMTQDLNKLEQAMNQKSGTAVDALPERRGCFDLSPQYKMGREYACHYDMVNERFLL